MNEPDATGRLIRHTQPNGFPSARVFFAHRCNSFMANSVAQKKPASKPKRPHLSGYKGGGGGSGSGGSREPQPQRLEDVYTALKRGLE